VGDRPQRRGRAPRRVGGDGAQRGRPDRDHSCHAGRLTMQVELDAVADSRDPFTIAGTEIGSRLLLGTAGYPNQRMLRAAVEASGCEIVTVSVRRISLKGHGSDTVGLLAGRRFLPNTAGCET